MVKGRKFIYLFSIIIVLAISVGYAALGSEMSISNLVAEVRIKQDIRITDVDIYNTVGSPNYNYVNYDNDSIVSFFSMNNGDEITFKVEITNIDNAEMGILNLSGLPEGVSYSFGDGYTEKDKLCNDSRLCNLGMVKEIYLTLKATKTIIGDEYIIEFNFQPFYSISYDTSITNNNYPTEIIKNSTLIITFIDSIPSDINVYIDGLQIDSSLYTYSNGVLTISNVTGHVMIKKVEPKTLFSIMQKATNGPDTNIDFSLPSSATNGDGVNTINGTENDEYPIYYYRGNVTNNNVYFAGFCWKMVRTTELGGVKLVYNGIQTNEICSGTNPSIGTSIYNNSTNSTYGSYADLRYIRTDGTDSSIKIVIDDWYTNNMVTYTIILEDEKWCNDTNFPSSGGYSSAYNRLSKSPYNPTLECSGEYQYYMSTTSSINRLKYPIALLTADETTYAGNGKSGYSSTNYLTTYYDWWTLTPTFGIDRGPSVAKMYVVLSNGLLYSATGPNFSYSYNVRPAITLKSTLEVINGDGSATNPYILDVPSIISFTIDGITYYALEGMTWGEWVKTASNTLGFVAHGTFINPPNKVNEYCVCSYYDAGTTTYPGHQYAQITHVIENGRSYHTEYY